MDESEVGNGMCPPADRRSVARSGPGGDVVLRIDPRTNRVVDRFPVDPPSGLAFGHGSVWATSAGHGTLSRIDPQTGEVVAKIEVGRRAVDVAADEGSGAVWVAGLYLPGQQALARRPPDEPRGGGDLDPGGLA
jgi:DNA-binding beta-propeller fold protein YncE